MTHDPTVYIVHCTDTEGPLFESLEASFERIEQIFGLKFDPSAETLRKLQAREIDLGGKEADVARVMAPELLEYNDSWEKIEAMLARIGSEEYRRELPDSEGGGWVYNWHCVDHIGYVDNPRRKTLGYHEIFDRYRKWIGETDAPDGLHWHFHPVHPSLAAHKWGTFYFRNSNFFDLLTRRLIERNWFPSVNRAGFHTERPDSHWLLEQWMPYDYSNQATDEEVVEADLAGGRGGDWRRAPGDWSVYHPSHDDYQVPGDCRRVIARCLNVGTRLRLIREPHVRQAFERARDVGPTIMSFNDHDYRDVGRSVDYVRDLLRKVTPDFPGVKFRYCEAREAMNLVLRGEIKSPSKNILNAAILPWAKEGTKMLEVTASEPIFGPQPYLAIQTTAGDFHYDNFDIQQPFSRWTYILDDITFPPETIRQIAIGTNDRHGYPHIVQISGEELR